MDTTLKVFSTTLQGKGYTATYYHGNEVTVNPDGTITDKAVPTPTNPTPHIVSFNVKFVKEAKEQIATNTTPFPLILTLKEGDYFITVDKDKDTKKARLDKNGRKHAVIVISAISNLARAPFKPMTLEDAYKLQ